MKSASYRSYGYIDCLHLDEYPNQPCWGHVDLVDVDTFQDADGNIDESLYYACEGHGSMYPFSILTPMGDYTPEFIGENNEETHP